MIQTINAIKIVYLFKNHQVCWDFKKKYVFIEAKNYKETLVNSQRHHQNQSILSAEINFFFLNFK